ncbi:MAG: hypothetical protein O6942_01025 [Bacteroidetes bacterium]|nr:hypothetical protein [Bacteroidota bacterium]
MKFKVAHYSLAALILLGFTSTGYEKNDSSQTLFPRSPNEAINELTRNRSKLCVELVTPQALSVGEVCLSNTPDSLNVHFQTEEGWFLTETHLAVASSLEEIPRVGPGIPGLGHFDYKSTHTSGSTEQTYSIALDSLRVSPGSEVVVAAHAGIVNALEEEEGAWGRGERFVEEGHPATYFSYVLDQP